MVPTMRIGDGNIPCGPVCTNVNDPRVSAQEPARAGVPVRWRRVIAVRSWAFLSCGNPQQFKLSNTLDRRAKPSEVGAASRRSCPCEQNQCLPVGIIATVPRLALVLPLQCKIVSSTMGIRGAAVGGTLIANFEWHSI